MFQNDAAHFDRTLARDGVCKLECWNTHFILFKNTYGWLLYCTVLYTVYMTIAHI